jgi:hypothetical protein
MKTQPLLSLAVALLAAAAAVPGASAAEQGPKTGAASREAVVVYELGGGSLTTVEALQVYSDGLSVLARSKGSDKICKADAAAAQVSALRSALQRAGALNLPSSNQGNPDVATKTVTFFEPRRTPGRTVANTFSFKEDLGAYGKVEAAIETFISSVFPGC